VAAVSAAVGEERVASACRPGLHCMVRFISLSSVLLPLKKWIKSVFERLPNYQKHFYLFTPRRFEVLRADVFDLSFFPYHTRADTPGVNPIPTNSYFVSKLRRRCPNFGYLHIIEPRVKGTAALTAPLSKNRTLWIRNPCVSGSPRAGSCVTAQLSVPTSGES
jgi:hypothetical protein